MDGTEGLSAYSPFFMWEFWEGLRDVGLGGAV